MHPGRTLCARCLAEDDGVKYRVRPVRDDASIVPYK